MMGVADPESPQLPLPSPRCRWWLAGIVLGMALLAGACAADQELVIDLHDGRASAFGFRNADDGLTAAGQTPEDDDTADITTGDAAATDTTTGDAADTGADEPSGTRIETRSLPPLVPGEAPRPPDVNEPIGLRVPSIEVDTATVVNVGVDDAGFLDVPAADEVGWYKFGPTPGSGGSAVLAAHIAYNGRDGVFRNLPDLAVGDEVFVQYEDDTEQAFEILGIVQYDKEDVPLDSLFDRSGRPRLVLITCGGDFNPQIRSYDDNIIAYAVPVEESAVS